MPRQPKIDLADLHQRVTNVEELANVLDDLTDEVDLHDLQGRIETLEDTAVVDVAELQNQIEILEGSLANLEERIKELESKGRLPGVAITVNQ